MCESIARLAKPVALVLATLLMLGATAATANAGKGPKKVDSNITLKFDNGDLPKRLTVAAFKGRVGSKVDRCERGRRVEITYKPQGGGSEPYGETNTDGMGRYEISAAQTPPGRYVAEVLRQKKGNTVCKGAKSDPYMSTIG
jgi:hypothetical protein